MMPPTPPGRRWTLALAILAASASVDVKAFVAPSARLPVAPTASSSSSLQLVPEQGSQLVAAFNAAATAAADHKKQGGYENVTGGKEEFAELNDFIAGEGTSVIGSRPAAVASAARAFVSRVGSILSDYFWREGEKEGDDVVLYPIVGFKFVQDEPNHFRALPTQSNPSCRIVNHVEQELYGWYCTACGLDSIFSEHYCEQPDNDVKV
jgi:hypothetical protein